MTWMLVRRSSLLPAGCAVIRTKAPTISAPLRHPTLSGPSHFYADGNNNNSSKQPTTAMAPARHSSTRQLGLGLGQGSRRPAGALLSTIIGGECQGTGPCQLGANENRLGLGLGLSSG
jgi:hypothetical protein